MLVQQCHYHLNVNRFLNDVRRFLCVWSIHFGVLLAGLICSVWMTRCGLCRWLVIVVVVAAVVVAIVLASIVRLRDVSVIWWGKLSKVRFVLA